MVRRAIRRLFTPVLLTGLLLTGSVAQRLGVVQTFTVHVRLGTSAHEPVNNAAVTLQSTDGAVVASGRTDAGGEVTASLATGRYVAVVNKSDEAPSTGPLTTPPFQVDGANPNTLTVLFTPVLVRARNADGAGLAGVNVAILTNTGAQALTGITNADGNFRFWSPNQTLRVLLAVGATLIGNSGNVVVPNVTSVTGVVNTTFTTP